jgi:hypothetical protein
MRRALGTLLKLSSLLGAGALLSLVGLGLSQSSWSLAHGGGQKVDVRYIHAFTNDDGVVNEPGRDPHDNGVDPGYDKRVAACFAEVVDSSHVKVRVINGYPSYTCRFWVKVKNTGDKTVKRKSQVLHVPPQLTVKPIDPLGTYGLAPGKWAYEVYTVHVEQSAAYLVEYQFSLENRFEQAKECFKKGH